MHTHQQLWSASRNPTLHLVLHEHLFQLDELLGHCVPEKSLLSTGGGSVRTSAPLLPPLGVLFLSITSAIARLPPMKSGWDVLIYASSNWKYEKNGA